jgi:hypothetical protein
MLCSLVRKLALLVLAAACATAASAQTIEDGVMMPRKTLCTGLLYSHDAWSRYWEGALLRTNGNIGTITNESVVWMADYGLTDRLNVIAMLPYVRTGASQGVLHGMSGLQDLTVGAKLNLLEAPFTSQGSLRTILVGSFATPVSDYSPDFQPLSIGTHSRRASGRLTLQFQAHRGWFLNTSSAYTWRDKVTLDRPSYYTNGQLFLSDEVDMPNVFEFSASAGYESPRFQFPITFRRQSTRGGGDIRRQDAPFVSNRMNAQRLDATVMYAIPGVRSLQARAMGQYAFRGRNVGRSTTIAGGFLYTFHF